MLATYMRRMRHNKLEIRIAGSSCRPQKKKKKKKFKMSSSLSIFRNRSAQVPVYFEIATCLPLMNMSRIVILYLACTFISFPFTKNSYEESKPGNKNQKARYSWRKANPGRMSTSGLR